MGTGCSSSPVDHHSLDHYHQELKAGGWDMALVLKATLLLQTKNRSANSKCPPVCLLALSAVFWHPLTVGCDGEHFCVPGLRLHLANWHRSIPLLELWNFRWSAESYLCCNSLGIKFETKRVVFKNTLNMNTLSVVLKMCKVVRIILK